MESLGRLTGKQTVEIRDCSLSPTFFKGNTMPVGTVKWFNMEKGYGFIVPENGGSDVFVHMSAVQAAGLATLAEGQRVEFETTERRPGKLSAQSLSLVE